MKPLAIHCSLNGISFCNEFLVVVVVKDDLSDQQHIQCINDDFVYDFVLVLLSARYPISGYNFPSEFMARKSLTPAYYVDKYIFTLYARILSVPPIRRSPKGRKNSRIIF